MRATEFALGNADFEKIINSGLYYIDKSAEMGKLLKDGAQAILFTRPRRFGKTTFQTMLKTFLDIRKDNSRLFANLAIMDDEETVGKWMNKYPVIFITFKEVDRKDFKSAFAQLEEAIKNLFWEYRFLAEAEMPNSDNALFARLMNKTGSVEDIKLSLSLLMRLMHTYYGKDVVLLLDEYDVPLAKAAEFGYYSDMLDVIRGMFSNALKDNPYLEKAVITGCMRISKESLFTGVNNLSVYSVTSSLYPAAFGFTDQEVEKLLRDTGLDDKIELFREWYDGYNIADTSLYASWDVLSYAKELMAKRDAMPRSYWVNSAATQPLINVLNDFGEECQEDFTALLNGGVIEKELNEAMAYNELHSSEASMFSYMLATGYLTLAGDYDETKPSRLRLPNTAVKYTFARCVRTWFDSMMKKDARGPLFNAIWERDDAALSRIITTYLYDSISYYDYDEEYYHAFLTGLLSGAGYIVRSNTESGLGRPDIVLKDRQKRLLVIFELKRARSFKEMEAEADTAIAQAQAKDYGKDEEGLYKTHAIFGIAFFKKSALAKTFVTHS